MSTGQQVIKVLAIIFAIFIIVNIFGGIIIGISTIIGIDMLGDSIRQENENVVEFSKVYETPVDSIKITAGISKLTVKTGKELKVEGSNLPSKFSSKIAGSTLVVKEEGNKQWKNKGISSELIITIPEGKTWESVTIDLGIGNHNLQDITAKRLKIECGVGTTQMSNVTTLLDTNIQGGAGRVTISESSFNNLNLEAGVGEMQILADITGNSKVDCGVGRLELNLQRQEKEYTIKTDTGIGRIALNGNRCTNGTYGKGQEKLKISGGVGAVEITTKENEK